MKKSDKRITENYADSSDSEWMPLDKDAHYHGKRVDSRHTIVRTSTGNDTTFETVSGSSDDAYDGLYAFFRGDWRLVGMDSDDLDLTLFNKPNASAVYVSVDYSADRLDALSSFITANSEKSGTFLICFEGIGFFDSLSILKKLVPENYDNFIYNVYDRADSKQVIRIFYVIK